MAKDVIYRLKRKNENPSVKGNYYPLAYTLKYKATVRHEGRERIIRCLEGANSPFLEDQLDQFGNAVQLRKRNITFDRGILRVSADDNLLKEFMGLLVSDPRYAANIELVDDSKVRANESADFDLEEEALKRWLDVKGNIEELRSYLRASGIRNVEDMTVDEIRHSVRRDSRVEPTKFLTLMNAPERSILSDTAKAVEQGLISNEKRSWFDLGESTPVKLVGFQIGNGDPTELFAEWLKTEGKDYYTALKKRIK